MPNSLGCFHSDRIPYGSSNLSSKSMLIRWGQENVDRDVVQEEMEWMEGSQCLGLEILSAHTADSGPAHLSRHLPRLWGSLQKSNVIVSLPREWLELAGWGETLLLPRAKESNFKNPPPLKLSKENMHSNRNPAPKVEVVTQIKNSSNTKHII